LSVELFLLSARAINGLESAKAGVGDMSKLGDFFVAAIVNMVSNQVEQDLDDQCAKLSQSKKDEIIEARLDKVAQILVGLALEQKLGSRLGDVMGGGA
jgi:hypothetical protein